MKKECRRLRGWSEPTRGLEPDAVAEGTTEAEEAAGAALSSVRHEQVEVMAVVTSGITAFSGRIGLRCLWRLVCCRMRCSTCKWELQPRAKTGDTIGWTIEWATDVGEDVLFVREQVVVAMRGRGMSGSRDWPRGGDYRSWGVERFFMRGMQRDVFLKLQRLGRYRRRRSKRQKLHSPVSDLEADARGRMRESEEGINRSARGELEIGSHGALH